MPKECLCSVDSRDGCVVMVDGEVVGHHYVGGNDQAEAMWIGLFLSDPFQFPPEETEAEEGS